MNLIKLFLAFNILLFSSSSFTKSLWTELNWDNETFLFKTSAVLKITKDDKNSSIVLNDITLSLDKISIEKLNHYHLRKRIRIFRKKLKSEGSRLLRITGPIKGRISKRKIIIWEYQFIYKKDKERLLLKQYYLKCGSAVFKLSYLLNKKQRRNSKIRRSMNRLIYSMQCSAI